MRESNHQSDTKGSQHDLSRRGFLAETGAAAVGLSMVQPKLVRGAAANEKIRIGLIGCGGRGTWIAQLFQQHGGYDIVALADYFEDQVTAAGEKLGVDERSRFTGLSAYKRLLDQKLDAVAIESPPYFHPIQAADAVAAGKHVYLAKPIAVDVPGCQRIETSGKQASDNQLCFLVDFQTRVDKYYVEALERVRKGALGKFAFGESTYHAGVPWTKQVRYARETDNPESRLRAWGVDRMLSGDIITEQNIHTLDVASWIMDQAPVSAYGTGGQKVRDYGNCYDTFCITLKYPNDVGIAFSSRQFDGHGSKPEGIRNRMFGTDGVLETAYGGEVIIKGKNFWRGGSSPGIYKDGAIANIAAFHANILAANYQNSTVPPSVRSNLVTILGRTAAYRGEIVTWDQILNSDQSYQPDLHGLKD
jgi:myo-inositol 2-dehydrogenase / D-chiro-inositol 1-dehydrogenase